MERKWVPILLTSVGTKNRCASFPRVQWPDGTFTDEVKSPDEGWEVERFTTPCGNGYALVLLTRKTEQ